MVAEAELAAAAKPAPLACWSVWAERFGLAALMAVATGLRLWHLWDIPSPTDELLGVGRGLAIARGKLLPLTDFEPYIGALWNYLLALGFLVAGPSQFVGRGVTMLVGALTVPAAFLLARELGGRLAAWIAAILLATSSAHILTVSHPAWSHAMVPLFAALGLWQLQRSLRRGDGRGLLGAGLWLGLALQAHLTALALLPGAGAYLWDKGRACLKTPWPYLASLIGLLLISNIVAFNVLTGFQSLRRAEAVQAAYARPKGSGLELYAGNLGRVGVASLRAISGAIDIRESPLAYVADPLVLLPASLTIGGVVLLMRRGNPLVVQVAAPYVLLLVVFNAKYEAVPNGRFLMPLLPLAFGAIGSLLAAGYERSGRSRAALGALVLVVAVLAGTSLVQLARRYDQMAVSQQATKMIFGALDELAAVRRPDEPVLLDRNLDRLWLDGGGDLWMAFSFELNRRGVPTDELPGRVAPPLGLGPCVRQKVVATRVNLARKTPNWVAEGLGRDVGQLPVRFWTFRVLPHEREIEPSDERTVFVYVPPTVGSSRTVDRCAPGRQI